MSRHRNRAFAQGRAGFTLIEILVTLVVIGIAAAALTGVYSNLVSQSADPAVRQQAITIAEAYIEEIMRKEFEDPFVAESGGAEGGETRATYNDVQDYNDLPDNVVRNQNNTPIAALAGYTVTVSVSGDTLNGVAAMRIDVSVNHQAIDPVSLSVFRTAYP